MSGSSVPRIQVFRPTMEEFKDFSKYIEKIESMGAHKAGLAKIIPPENWCPRKNGYDDVDLVIPAPIQQVVTGREGLFNQYNMQKKAMTVKEFQKLAESPKFRTPSHFDYEDLERKYWKNIAYNPPIYGADVSGSLYDDGVEEFNIQHLNTILDLVKEDYEIQIEGVNTAYLYFGMWKTTFAWHTEDMDLYSINYLHFGAPKSWYAVPPEHGRRLERLAQNYFHGSYNNCPAFLRHKMTIISPHILRNHSIPYNKITQEPGEFMITFPFGYHAGFNHGYNCAESTNFALPRWIEYGKRASACTCRNDCVKICMDMFVRKFQPDRYELWKVGRDMGAHPEEPSKIYAAPAPNKLELALAAKRVEQKKAKQAPGYQKIKRHPISKVNKNGKKYKPQAVLKDDEDDSDTKETEIYDMEDVADDDSTGESRDVVLKMSKSDIEKDLKAINSKKKCKWSAASVKEEKVVPPIRGLQENEYYDEDTLLDPPVLEEEKLEIDPPPLVSAESSSQQSNDLSIQVHKSSPTLINEDLLNKFPKFKEAISSGALKLTCVPPHHFSETSKQVNIITVGMSPVKESQAIPPASYIKELPVLSKMGCHDDSAGSADGATSWTCKYTQGLKVKFVQPKQYAPSFSPPKQRTIIVHSQTTTVPIDNLISVSTVVPQEEQIVACSSSTNAAVSPGQEEQSIGKSGGRSADDTSTTEDECPRQECKKSAKSSPGKVKDRKRCRRDSKSSCSGKVVKAASDSLDNWALPILDLWHHRPLNFEAEQKFNMHCSMIEPHCCVCMIFTPMDITKNYPGPPNESVHHSKVKMPTFCFGNGIDNQCILDPNPMLSKDGTSPILVCRSCKISVHAACYGVTMIQMGAWTCTRCAKNALDAQCCLCVLRGGALKPTGDGRWAHILCTILIPETYFENIVVKEPVNLSKLTPMRQKLKCKYCFKSAHIQVPLAGACIQCLSGKCYLPFHVTCGYVAGVVYEANDWPEPINIMCTKHVGSRRKPQKRNLTTVKAGDRVLAKHSNRRWYWVEVKQTYMQEFYSVLFEDNSTSTNTLPEDLVYREFTPSGRPEINEKIHVKWTDGKIYSALFKGSRFCEIFMVEFDDGKILSVERPQIYAADEHIPRAIMSKMSHSSDRQDHFKIPSEGKRRRIANHRYFQDS